MCVYVCWGGGSSPRRFINPTAGSSVTAYVDASASAASYSPVQLKFNFEVETKRASVKSCCTASFSFPPDELFLIGKSLRTKMMNDN